jgi:hypothetical protein
MVNRATASDAKNRNKTLARKPDLFPEQWPCNTSSENSSKSKNNTTSGKTVLKLVNILMPIYGKPRDTISQ